MGAGPVESPDPSDYTETGGESEMKNSRKKTQKNAKKIGGPFLAAAFFCDNIIEDASDKTISVARIIDGCQIKLPPETPADVPSNENPVPISQNALISFRGGDSPGRHVVKFILIAPDGSERNPIDQWIDIPDGPNGGANVKLKIGFMAYETGLFIVNVYLDGSLVTRMPYMVTIEKEKPPTVKRRKAAVL